MAFTQSAFIGFYIHTYIHTHINTYIHTYIHTYHSRFIFEEVAEASQIFLLDVHILAKLLSFEEYTTDVTGDKPIAV
jgi:hypothetical protein